MNKQEYVSNKPLSGIRDAAGIGFLIIPSDQEVKKYIQHCYRTNTVSIALENGGIIDNVSISRESINQLDFPDATNVYGTQLVWIKQPRKNQLIIIGSISKTNEFTSLNENINVLRRANKKKGLLSEVVVNSDKGVLIINSSSSSEVGGDIYILSTNKNKSSKCNVQVSGDINIISTNLSIENSKKLSIKISDINADDNITEISYEKGIGLSYKDEFKNEAYINNDNIQFKPNSKFNIGDGNEPMLLSDTFKKILEDLTDLISTIAQDAATLQVGTVFGPSTIPTNTANFIQSKAKIAILKKKYKTFQSKKGFTD